MPSKLLEANGGAVEWLDGGAAGAAIGSDPPLEPWEQATGLNTEVGKARSSRNADKGGKPAAFRAELATLRACIRALDHEEREGRLERRERSGGVCRPGL